MQYEFETMAAIAEGLVKAEYDTHGEMPTRIYAIYDFSGLGVSLGPTDVGTIAGFLEVPGKLVAPFLRDPDIRVAICCSLHTPEQIERALKDYATGDKELRGVEPSGVITTLYAEDAESQPAALFVGAIRGTTWVWIRPIVDGRLSLDGGRRPEEKSDSVHRMMQRLWAGYDKQRTARPDHE